MSFKLTAVLDIENNDKDRYPMLKFTCDYATSDGMGYARLFTFKPESGSGKWLHLLNACVIGSVYHIDWIPCNGKSSITVSENIVTFQMVKHGDGYMGSLEVSIPASSCVGAFEEAHRITSKWLADQ